MLSAIEVIPHGRGGHTYYRSYGVRLGAYKLWFVKGELVAYQIGGIGPFVRKCQWRERIAMALDSIDGGSKEAKQRRIVYFKFDAMIRKHLSFLNVSWDDAEASLALTQLAGVG